MSITRKVYRELSSIEKDIIDKFKADADALHGQLEAFGASRETSLAKTKLEECVMWAVKHLTA